MKIGIISRTTAMVKDTRLAGVNDFFWSNWNHKFVEGIYVINYKIVERIWVIEAHIFVFSTEKSQKNFIDLLLLSHDANHLTDKDMADEVLTIMFAVCNA